MIIDLGKCQAVLKQYVKHVNSSTMLAKEITELFRSPVRLANLLLGSESPVPCHTEMTRYLVEAYPFIDDVEGRSLCITRTGCLVRLNSRLVHDFIVEVISNTEGQVLAGTVSLITQDMRSNFVMKLALGFVSSFLRMSAFGLPDPSHLI